MAALAAVAFLPAELEPLIVPLFAWVVLVYASDAGIVSRALHKKLPQMLGRVSYSIYMTHYVVSLTIQALLVMFTGLTSEVAGDRIITGPWWFGDMMTLIYLVIVVGVSRITYAWIEKPGRAWFNQKAEPVPAAW
ncbi:MAG: acyltransferase family protein [Alphaproteobacteria bacterium]